MAGNPAAFEPTAFENNSFQTGAAVVSAAVATPTLQGGGSAEEELQAYHSRRHARLKQVELAERHREEAKQALAVEEKKSQAKSAARQNDTQRQRRAAKIAKYQAQIVDLDHSIAEALTELRQMLEHEQNRQQDMADRRRRLLLIALAAA